MGHVGMVNELELLDDSNSGFHTVDVYDIDTDAWYRARSRSVDRYITSEELTKKINEEMMRIMRGPEVFDAEVVIHDVT